MSSSFEVIGGEPALRAIVRDFVGKMTSDPMIGFFFEKVDRARLEEKEYEHAAAHLGADVTYTGKPLRAAHGPHRIFGGQFARRKEILRQVLVAHGVPEDVRQGWLDHVESLRGEITTDPGSQCR
ncbi:MAG: group 1 truncated hemoglobin [Myxococcota bacterium]|nr:group 1 truncated hemoglobin [Myxococcota bacterium]